MPNPHTPERLIVLPYCPHVQTENRRDLAGSQNAPKICKVLRLLAIHSSSFIMEQLYFDRLRISN